MTPSVWINGNAGEQNLDRGLQFADGHFTSVRITAGRACWWDYHCQRLLLACERLQLPAPTRQQLDQMLAKVVSSDENCVVKIIITRGSGGRGYLPPSSSLPNHYWVKSPLPTAQPALRQVQVAELRLGRQPALAGLKTLNRLEQVLLAQEREQRQLDDLLVLDQEQYLIEACQGNLFWRQGRQWYTPALHRCGVDGVARQVILAHKWLGQVNVGDFKLPHLWQAEQAFICNSVRGAVPIARLNGNVLTTQLPTGLTALIS
ncbi:aminodeoxychorismate lyase [Idiomarina seosinensis]|uniref:aminodeoxychorismate lyase n=1 Tax=Idiomarina seosinensis TaxID=281739 RepID=UPI00384DA6CB